VGRDRADAWGCGACEPLEVSCAWPEYSLPEDAVVDVHYGVGTIYTAHADPEAVAFCVDAQTG